MATVTSVEMKSGDIVQEEFSLENNALKHGAKREHLEKVDDGDTDLVYDDIDHEPKLHRRTWMALVAMFVLNLVSAFALFSPAAVLSFIAADLDGEASETWIQNSLLLVSATMSPLVCSASDVFQARKMLLVGSIAIAFIGAAIAPGSQSMTRLLAAQSMIGMGFASLPLGYSVPSEITPRRWRPLVQAWMNVANALGAICGPLITGALTKANPGGWRKFFWIEMALWVVCGLGILVGYQPPKRRTHLGHHSLMQKLGQLDITGFALLASGLSLFLAGLNLGGELYSWTNVRVLVTLILGIVLLLTFGLYEWKGTKTGVLHHDFFRSEDRTGRAFTICILLVFIEGGLVFAYVIFYPVLTLALFETDTFKLVIRGIPFWVTCLIACLVWAHLSTRFRMIREFLCMSLLIWTGGLVGLATIQPGDRVSAIAFAAVAGIGQGGLLVLIIAGIQLATPHPLIGTVSSLTVATRSVAAAVFTAIYAAALSRRLTSKIPAYVSKAALQVGIPPSSIRSFVTDLANNDFAALSKIPGVTPTMIDAGVAALKQAKADSLRVVFLIAAPLGAAACILSLFLGDLRKTMNYRVDAPLEVLTANASHGKNLENAIEQKG